MKPSLHMTHVKKVKYSPKHPSCFFTIPSWWPLSFFLKVRFLQPNFEIYFCLLRSFWKQKPLCCVFFYVANKVVWFLFPNIGVSVVSSGLLPLSGRQTKEELHGSWSGGGLFRRRQEFLEFGNQGRDDGWDEYRGPETTLSFFFGSGGGKTSVCVCVLQGTNFCQFFDVVSLLVFGFMAGQPTTQRFT